MCVHECVGVCLGLLVKLSDTSKQLAPSLLDEGAVVMFIVTCFSTKGLHTIKSRGGGIKEKKEKRRESGRNIAKRDSYSFLLLETQ